MLLMKGGKAGTTEKGDVMVSVEPAAPGSGVSIELASPVKNQYGRQMTAAIRQVVDQYRLEDVAVNAADRGALDFAIRARTETAIVRALDKGE
jgi:citrate lyase subunit gamma (acyl carrier protein)